ncbi:MAG: hypothetical protein NVS1B13_23830 [Flavisolibacter sp.]
MTSVMALAIGDTVMAEIIIERKDKMGRGKMITTREIVLMREPNGSKIEMPAGREFLATEQRPALMDLVKEILANPGHAIIMGQNLGGSANNRR